jgi:L-lactate permease
LQVILIGFSFGAFLEGSAGFGAPVAITAGILVALGLQPLYAAGLCLIANTAPVAFGALGIPILVAGKTTGIDPMLIGMMAGRQLPLLSMFVPFFLVWLMDGCRDVRQTWPAVLVAGLSFALAQYYTSNYIGPELPDITSALVSMLALSVFLRFWQPKEAFTFGIDRCQPRKKSPPIRINLGRCHARSRKFGEKNKRPPIVRYDRVFCRNKNHTKQKEAA